MLIGKDRDQGLSDTHQVRCRMVIQVRMAAHQQARDTTAICHDEELEGSRLEDRLARVGEHKVLSGDAGMVYTGQFVMAGTILQVRCRRETVP